MASKVSLDEKQCLGRNCLIVGSAPTVGDRITKFRDRIDDWLILGANGGAIVSYEFLGRCDILVTTSYLYEQRSAYDTKISTELSKLSFGVVWMFYEDGSSPRCRLPGYNRLQSFDRSQRDVVVSTICGTNYNVSSGVWAACLAAKSGARSVALAGISMLDGHYKSNGDEIRDHKIDDTHAINKLRNMLQ